jgi:hypothetical protein
MLWRTPKKNALALWWRGASRPAAKQCMSYVFAKINGHI